MSGWAGLSKWYVVLDVENEGAFIWGREAWMEIMRQWRSSSEYDMLHCSWLKGLLKWNNESGRGWTRQVVQQWGHAGDHREQMMIKTWLLSSTSKRYGEQNLAMPIGVASPGLMKLYQAFRCRIFGGHA